MLETRAEAAVGKVEGQIVAAQVQLIRLDVPGPVAQQVAAGASLQPYLQLAGDRAGQLVLRRENVLHLPIVGCRPAGRAVARVDESDLEAKPRADPPESALEDVGHAQAVGDTRSEEHTSELQSQSNLVC